MTKPISNSNSPIPDIISTIANNLKNTNITKSTSIRIDSKNDVRGSSCRFSKQTVSKNFRTTEKYKSGTSFQIHGKQKNKR